MNPTTTPTAGSTKSSTATDPALDAAGHSRLVPVRRPPVIAVALRAGDGLTQRRGRVNLHLRRQRHPGRVECRLDSSPTSSRTPLAPSSAAPDVGTGPPPRPDGRVTVADHGAGFGPAARDELFDAYRLHTGSTGLGLVVCKSIVEARGATSSIEPDAGGGRISFTVPLAE
jgi:signal transduction histidine kinase